MKTVVIGLGTQGLKRRKSLIKKKFFVCSVDPKNKNADEKSINSLKKYNYDTVFLCVPDQLKKKYILYFLKKKKNIFVEKPLNLSKRDLLNIEKVSNKFKVTFYVGYNHRFHPSFILAKKIISENKIGKIMYIRAVYGHGGRKNYHKEWRFKKKLSGGGELIDKGSHLIDLSRLFLGNLKVHSSFLANYFWKTNLDDNCFISLKNNKNNFSFLHSSSTEWKNKFIFEIFCKKGKIEIFGLGKSYGKEKLILYKMSKNMGIPKKKEYKFTNAASNRSWTTEINDFYDSIVKSKPCYPNLNDVYNNLKIIDKIYNK